MIHVSCSVTSSSLGQNSLRWRHNGQDSVSNHQPRDCFLNRLFRHRSKKTSKLRVTGLCVGNSPGTDEFPAQMASDAENVSIWWRHHVWPYHSRKNTWTISMNKPKLLKTKLCVDSIYCMSKRTWCCYFLCYIPFIVIPSVVSILTYW